MEIQKLYTRDILEITFASDFKYSNPYIEGELSIHFYSPDGENTIVKGFWDGANVWKVRFAPSLQGIWKWESKSENKTDKGLNGKAGIFEVISYEGNNPILKHGFLKVSDNGRGFEHEDGKKFFWLGDTVWGVTAKGKIEDWKDFIDYRNAQGFNVVCINALSQYDGSVGVSCLEPYESEGNMMKWDRPNISYFQCLDKIMDITKQAGMYTALVALWFDFVPGANAGWETVRKEGLTPDLAALYGSYMAARYSAFGAIWFISGDSDFNNEEAISIYSSTARSIQRNTPYEPLITAHLQMGLVTPEALNDMEWFNFHMYQSSHRMESVQTSIDCAKGCRALKPVRPVLNGEPCYENICCYKELDKKLNREFTREVLWKSILAGGNAGITYGAHGIWSWHCEGEPFHYEKDWGMPVSWREAMKFEGSDDAVRMKIFFEELPWWELEPANCKFNVNYSEGIIAATPDASHIVAYISKGKQLKFEMPLKSKYMASIFVPANGDMKAEEYVIKDGEIHFDFSSCKNDTVILLKADNNRK